MAEGDKAALRRMLRARRHLVPPAVRAASSRALADALLREPAVADALRTSARFAVYLAGPDELDLAPFVARLRASRASVAVPFWDAASGLYALAEYARATPLAAGPHGIPEPAAPVRVAPRDVAVWIVPGLGFTRAGARLGYGGGWYDRFLAAAAPDARALGVGYSFQVLDSLPVEPHDRLLDGLVTVSEEM